MRTDKINKYIYHVYRCLRVYARAYVSAHAHVALLILKFVRIGFIYSVQHEYISVYHWPDAAVIFVTLLCPNVTPHKSVITTSRDDGISLQKL